jgi:hypothetical protein
MIEFTPAWCMNPGEAWQIVKARMDDESVPIGRKVQAIEMVARFETLNSITKDELQRALRWLFDHYEFGA